MSDEGLCSSSFFINVRLECDDIVINGSLDREINFGASGVALQSTLYHQSQTPAFSENIVPFGHKKLCFRDP